MDKNQKQLSDYVAEAVMSLGAIELAQFMTIAFMTFFSHHLFYSVLPDDMVGWHRSFASWGMAIVWEWTTLITTGNKKHFGKAPWIPRAMSICSGIIVLFFISKNTGKELTWYMITQSLFVGTLAAVLNAVFSDLFHKKVLERKIWFEMPELVENLKQQVAELIQKLNASEANTKRVEAENASQLLELVQLRTKLEAFGGEELECPHCHEVQPSRGALNSHKGKCKENPINKNKQGIGLNGHVHA